MHDSHPHPPKHHWPRSGVTDGVFYAHTKLMHEWSVSWNVRPCKLRAFMASNLNACPVLYSMHVLQALLNVDCKNHNCLDLVSTVRRDLRLTWMKWDGAPILGTRFLLLLSRAASSHFKVCFRQWRLCVCNRVGRCSELPRQTNIPQPSKQRCFEARAEGARAGQLRCWILECNFALKSV